MTIFLKAILRRWDVSLAEPSWDQAERWYAAAAHHYGMMSRLGPEHGFRSFQASAFDRLCFALFDLVYREGLFSGIADPDETGIGDREAWHPRAYSLSIADLFPDAEDAVVKGLAPGQPHLAEHLLASDAPGARSFFEAYGEKFGPIEFPGDMEAK